MDDDTTWANGKVRDVTKPQPDIIPVEAVVARLDARTNR